MLSIILTGHGGFASGMEKAMKQILGEQSQFIAIDFPETSSTALLTSQLEEAIAQLDCEDGIVFLTDLLGGTPFRVQALECGHRGLTSLVDELDRCHEECPVEEGI
ncbi:N-acetylgalactosamine-specific PTS system EIIA component 2 [Escherichia marmotae]|uniref:N-acetylgalactosamine-specific PTS system EIIA component 2 n=1 Tax=Escherichia marmotae TaxID=1499973 RepID=A0A7Z9CZI1_9ESCH|nr:PTS sugar transporter subunit IIA [Escherichia marmotae]EGD4400788.1 PTS N-acetylgalactosamine transporter subunit IIA [Escherichia coli]VED81604.1 N-acetylgalactosamine-specific PTS system EIIA component 2 [Escherichia marmotae]